MRDVSDLCELAVDCVNKTAPIVDFETPYKMIRTTNVKGGFIDLGAVDYVTEEVFEKWTRRSRPMYGDVILTREAPVGEVGRFTSSDDGVFLGQRLFHYRPDPELLDWNYLAFALQSHDVQGRLRGMGFGATVDHIKVPDAEHLRIPCPPIEVQRRIGAILSAYDDLLENNRRRMAMLEETARHIYEEWFVRLRFPGHEHVRIEDGVPDGWREVPLAELAEMVMGQSPESSYYNQDGEGLPFHQGVSDFGERFVTNRVYSTASYRVAEPGDILCSVRAPVGRLNVTLDRIVIGRGLAALRSKSGHQPLLLQQLRSHFFKEDLIGGGAIFASVTKKELAAQALLDPPDFLKRAFDEIAGPCDAQLRLLFLQNQQLRAARDLLLPRLMSGQLAV